MQNILIKDSINKAIKQLGTEVKLADALGVKSPTIQQWKNGRRPVPPKRCVQLENLLGIPRVEFRPDDWQEIWPEFKGNS